jgi:predicted nucleic acid-binding protein
MGVLTACRGRRVYHDSNIFIYAVEGMSPAAEAVGELFDLIDAAKTTAVSSDLTLAELLVRPLELGRDDLVGIYAELLQPSPGLTVSPIDRAVLIAAAHLRTQRGLRLPDATHVATALASSCELFVSNDRKIKLPVTMVLLPLR